LTCRSAATLFTAPLAFVMLAGCGSDTDLAEAVFTAERDGVHVRVWIPVNEARSVGTLRADVDWGNGSSDRVEADRDGMISGVWLEDLTGGTGPELVIATSSAGSGSYGTALVYSRTGDRLRRLPIANLDDEQREGYMGHDVYTVVGGMLLRTFPTYAEGDANARPSGPERSFRYDFNEGGWVPLTPQ
jgi:hypothetical protein